MMTRRDWWIGVLLIVLAVLAHALVPRYEYRNFGEFAPGIFTRIDRWTGSAELVSVRTDEAGRAMGTRLGARALHPLRVVSYEPDPPQK